MASNFETLSPFENPYDLVDPKSQDDQEYNV